MRVRILWMPLLLLLPGLLYGQAKVGTAGAQFLELGVSARAVAMGEAFVAVANDATAVYYNPAGLTQCSRIWSTRRGSVMSLVDWRIRCTVLVV
jgi:hypothetical protein